MPDISTSTTSIPFGSNLRIGYRLNGSVSPYTYVPYYPSFNELPYTFSVPTSGTWQIEYTVVCAWCEGPIKYSSPDTTLVTV